jgi:hypothetical protein
MLAFVLGLVANLLTKPIQGWLDSRIRSRADHKLRYAAEVLEKAKRYKEHPEEFHAFQLESLVWMIRYTGPLILGTGILVVLTLVDREHTSLSPATLLALSFTCMLIVAVCALLITRWGRRALDMAFIVRNLPKYEALEESAAEAHPEP